MSMGTHKPTVLNDVCQPCIKKAESQQPTTNLTVELVLLLLKWVSNVECLVICRIIQWRTEGVVWEVQTSPPEIPEF
jgi:hypothetical protein